MGSRNERTNQSQGLESNIAIGLFFCLRLQQCSFHLMVSDGVISGISVLLLTLLDWFSLDHIALHFWVWLRLHLPRKWKPVPMNNLRSVWPPCCTSLAINWQIHRLSLFTLSDRGVYQGIIVYKFLENNNVAAIYNIIECGSLFLIIPIFPWHRWWGCCSCLLSHGFP